MLEITDIRPLRDNELTEWDELAADSPEGTVYHGSLWLKAISKAVQQNVVIYGFFTNKTLVGGMPLTLRKKGPISIAQRAFATPYSWGIMKDTAQAEVPIIPSSVQEFVSRSFSQAILTSSPFQKKPNFSTGWTLSERATYLLDIKDENTVWKNFVPELRNQIRKAQRAGVSVNKFQDIKHFYRLYQETFARQGKKTPFREDYFVEFIKTLQTQGLGEYYLATLEDGRPCAAALMVQDSKRVYYSLAASDNQLRKTGASPLLIWQAICDFASTHQEMDLGGANIQSITQFKKQFRGELRNYQEAQSFRSGTERILLNLYQKIRG